MRWELDKKELAYSFTGAMQHITRPCSIYFTHIDSYVVNSIFLTFKTKDATKIAIFCYRSRRGKRKKREKNRGNRWARPIQ